MEKDSAASANKVHNTRKVQEIEYYQRVIRKMPAFTPFCINAHLRLAQLFTEIGEKDAAIKEYSLAAGQYAQNGAVVKAIAVNKMIIGLDPARGDALARLSELYFQRSALVKSSGTETPRLTSENILARVPLFRELQAVELQCIAEFLSPVNIPERTVVIQEGEQGDCMYLIQTGEVGVYTTLEQELSGAAETEPELLHLATLQAGDFFGEQALLTNEPRNATIIAMTAAQLLRFAKPDLAAIVKSYPRIREVLTQYHHQRNAHTIASLKAALQNMRAS